jgi:acyl transferase domain-containing protein/acyl carrier protein
MKAADRLSPSPLLPFSPSPDEALDQTQYAQVALFVVEYALAQLWMHWGVQPQALIGHSVGEYVAACLAGVFSLEDALALVSARGRLMQQMPAGAMLAAPLPEEEIAHMLGQDLSLAAINGPAQSVVSGPPAALERLELQLAGEGVICRRLPASHAFHSQMMDPIVAPFVELVRQTRLHPPLIPYISNVTGTWISAAEATDPTYWGRHLRQTVRFSAGLAELLRDAGRIMLEVGPGRTLSRLVGQHPAWLRDRIALASLPRLGDPLPEQVMLLASLGRLWLAGAPVEWACLYAREQRRRVALPSYPFERKRYWIEPGESAGHTGQRYARASKRPDIADWFYIPSWKRSAPPALDRAEAGADARRRWLVFMDGGGLGRELVQRLERDGQPVVAVTAGERFERLAGGEYAVNPRIRDDYVSLIEELRAIDRSPSTIVHLWSITSVRRPLLESAQFRQAQEAGFYSLLFLAQALASAPVAGPLRIEVVSNWLCSVVYDEDVAPEKATILGACKVIPQEHPNITCRAIDLAVPGPGTQHAAGAVDRLLVELAAPAPGAVVAYRGNQRWVQSYEPVRLEGAGGPNGLLRDGGVYLVTGGLEGIGFALTAQLARTVRARLILIEDPAFPARDEWGRWLAAHDEHDDASRKIRNVWALEQAGAEVLILGAQIADIDQVEEVVQRAVERFGALHGVIHAAPVGKGSAFRAVQETHPAECELLFEPKVYSTLALAHALRQRSLDFCLLVSSLASVLGGLGALAYTAANLVIDAVAQQQNKSGRCPWLSVNWDAWRLAEDHAAGEHLAQFSMTPHEGVETFRRIMSMPPIGQLVVSTGDLTARIDQWIKLEGVRSPESAQDSEGTAPLHPRPKLATAYSAPKSDIERLIADIWQQALGIDSVGVNDNFFDLGGDSLIAVQAIARLKQALGVDIPITSLYEGLTIRSLTGLLELEQRAAQPIQPSATPFDGRDTRIARKRHYQQAQRLRRGELKE